MQFLTAIPLPFSLDVDNEDFGKGLIFAPIVGLLIGSILALAYFAAGWVGFPPYIASIFIVILYIILTGGLHMDGLGDTFDGLFSNRSRERILEIMRDSRVGTNAVLAIVSVILLNASLLSGISKKNIWLALLLFPVAGRIGSLVGAGASTYARSGEGLGKSFIDCCGVREVAIGLILCLPVFVVLDRAAGIFFFAASSVTAFLLVKFFSRKIGGATGDILGAVCELNQTVFLVMYFIQSTICSR